MIDNLPNYNDSLAGIFNTRGQTPLKFVCDLSGLTPGGYRGWDSKGTLIVGFDICPESPIVDSRGDPFP